MQERANVIALNPESADANALIERAGALARDAYGERLLGTGETALAHAGAIAATLASLQQDAAAIGAGWLFALPQYREDWRDAVVAGFGDEVGFLLDGLTRLHRLRDVTRAASEATDTGQRETLRKMLLAMVSDVRVVLIRLASRLATLRHLTAQPDHPQRLNLGPGGRGCRARRGLPWI